MAQADASCQPVSRIRHDPRKEHRAKMAFGPTKSAQQEQIGVEPGKVGGSKNSGATRG